MRRGPRARATPALAARGGLGHVASPHRSRAGSREQTLHQWGVGGQDDRRLLVDDLVVRLERPDEAVEVRIRRECLGVNARRLGLGLPADIGRLDRKSTRLNSSHVAISYAVFCLK